MATRRNTKQAQPRPTWVSPTVAVLGLLAGAVLVWFGYPGVALTWLVTVVASWTASRALFTGKKDASGFPTAAHPGEAKAMQRYRFWADLKWHLIFPTNTLLPGWPVYASWIFGAWAAAVFWCLPYADVPYVGDGFRHVDAVLAFILVTQVAAARRRTVVVGDVSPGVRINAIKNIKDAEPKALAIGAGVTLLATALGSWTAGAYLPAPPVPVVGGFAWFVLGAIGGLGAGSAWWWVKSCLTPWRIVVAARAEWAPRWQMLKHDPAPFLTARDTVGNATIDTFMAPGSMGAMAYWSLAPKVTPTMGAGQRIAILSTPNTDSQGQPQPGTRHPLQFQVVYWPADAIPDVMDLGADPDEVKLLIQCAMVWACDESGYARPILDEVHPLALTEVGPPVPTSGEEDPEAETALQASPLQAWATTWMLPDGPPFKHLRTVLGGSVAGFLNAQVLVDHRAEFFYIGDLTSGNTVFDPSTDVSVEGLTKLATEDEWNGRWAEVLKQDVNPPTIEHPTYDEAKLANGKTVYRQAFVTLRGVDPMDFFGLESKIAATLDAAPFVSVAGWPSRGRPGERHPQAFSVYWSSDAVPANPDTLPPTGERDESAAKWILGGRINSAFKAARLASPEVFDAKCLTQPRSRGHIWRIALRLYGGVTLSDVRGASQRLRQALGSEWLRVESAKDGCVIVAGVSPTKARLANPGRDERYLASLDWDQAFLDAKVVGVGGLTPSLTEVDRLPNNNQVQVLDFTLPSGLAFVDVKAKTKPLETSSNNAFVEIRRHPSGKAGEFRILASEVNPMPERAGFDYEAAETGDHKIPFATNLFGEPTTYDNSVDSHLLISGASGGGKSVALQSFIYGALIRDWDLYVVDPSKGAVDFNFAEPYARAVGRTVWEAKGIIAAIYEEVLRRKAINGKYNCGNYRDLPEEVRYNHVLIVLDEFTSMMMPEPVPKAMDDSAETLQAIESVKNINAARAFIGTYVGKIVREARSTGFTMLLATQALKADTLAKIPGANDLKDNMSRMIVGRASFGQLMAALKAATEAPEQPDALPPGRGLYEGNGRTAEVIQCWFEPSQSTFAQHLATRIAPVPEHAKVDLTNFVEPDLEVDGMRLDDSPIITTIRPHSPAPLDGEIVELDAIELSLDDLELSLDELEEADEHEADQVTAAPIIPSVPPVFDWDAAEAQAGTTPAEEAPVWDESDISEDGALDDDGVDIDEHIVWDEIDPEPWQPAESEYGWSEIDAVLGFLADFDQVKSITWSDVHLFDEDDMGIRYLDVVLDLLEQRGVALIAPEPSPAPEVPVAQMPPAPVSVPADDFGPEVATVPVRTQPAHPNIADFDDDDFGPTPKTPTRPQTVVDNDDPFA